MKKTILVLTLVMSLFTMPTLSHATVTLLNQTITKISSFPPASLSAIYVTLSSGSSECTGGTFSFLQDSGGYYKDSLALLISAFSSGKQVDVVANSCSLVQVTIHN